MCAYVPQSGSVVAFQSDPTKLQAHASVSGQIGSSILGTVPVIQSGTVISSISGTVNVDPTSSVIVIRPSVMSYGGSIGSVSGQVGASVIGTVPVTQSGAWNPSVSGTVGSSVIGTVPVTQSGTLITSIVSTVPSSVQVGASIIGTVPITGDVGQSGTRITSIVSTIPSSVLVGASILGLPPVNVTNFPVNQNISGSVVGFQGTNPWIVTGSVQTTVTTSNSSVQVLNFPTTQNVSGSVASYPQGTIISSLVSTVPSSVIVGASVFGNAPVTQITNPWIITGSVQGAGAGTQYSEPTVVTSITGTAIVFKSNISSSVMSAVTVAAPLPVSVQGTIGASVIGAPPVTQGGTWIASVFGNVSVLGTVPVTQSGTWITSVVSTIPSSVLAGASIFGQLPGGTATLGSVAAVQGTNPWIVTGSVQGAFSPSGNQSVSGTVDVAQIGAWRTSVISSTPSSLLSGASIFGQLPAGTAPIGSVATLQGTNPWIITGSVQGAFSPSGNQSVSGTVDSAQIGTRITSVVSSTPSSMLVGTSIFGQLPAGTAPLGSVATLQGTNPWITTFSNSSVLAVPVGSVIVLNQGSSILAVPVGSTITIQQAPSIVGTYAEDAAHATADKGMFILGVRNDAVSSITSAERDYSPVAVDDVGRNIVVPFAGQQACIISYVGSVVSASVTLIKASVIGSRSYITDFLVANTGATDQLITFQGGDTSVIGYTIAPAGGGSNAPGIAIPLRTTLSQDLAFKATGTSSVVYMTVKGYQAP